MNRSFKFFLDMVSYLFQFSIIPFMFSLWSLLFQVMTNSRPMICDFYLFSRFLSLFVIRGFHLCCNFYFYIWSLFSIMICGSCLCYYFCLCSRSLFFIVICGFYSHYNFVVVLVISILNCGSCFCLWFLFVLTILARICDFVSASCCIHAYDFCSHLQFFSLVSFIFTLLFIVLFASLGLCYLGSYPVYYLFWNQLAFVVFWMNLNFLKQIQCPFMLTRQVIFILLQIECFIN